MTIQFKTYSFNESEQLGKGASGVIVGGSTPRGSRVVAKIGDSFAGEAHLLSLVDSLNIPHAVKILDSGFFKDREVIVLDRAYSSRQLNQTLNVDQLLAKEGMKAFDGRQIISCMKQLLEFLAEMKKNKIVHRDLKCENLICELESGQIRVVDFGGARLYKEHCNLQRQGTFYCLPPEVLLKQKNLRYAGDMWAAGIILFMMYTGGKIPFRDGREKVLKTVLSTFGLPSDEYLETCGYARLELASMVEKRYRRDWRGLIRLAAEERRDSKKQVDQIIDLLEQIFRYDDLRISPEKALNHPLFESDVHLALDCREVPKEFTLSVGGLRFPLVPATRCIHVQKTSIDEYPMSILDAQNKCILASKEKLVPGSRIHVSMDDASKLSLRVVSSGSIPDRLQGTHRVEEKSDAS